MGAENLLYCLWGIAYRDVLVRIAAKQSGYGVADHRLSPHGHRRDAWNKDLRSSQVACAIGPDDASGMEGNAVA